MFSIADRRLYITPIIFFFSIYFFQGIILFCVTVVVIIAASFLREAIPLEDLAGLTWKTLHNKKKPEPNHTG
jgi:hypothetical protein